MRLTERWKLRTWEGGNWKWKKSLLQSLHNLIYFRNFVSCWKTWEVAVQPPPNVVKAHVTRHVTHTFYINSTVFVTNWIYISFSSNRCHPISNKLWARVRVYIAAVFNNKDVFWRNKSIKQWKKFLRIWMFLVCDLELFYCIRSITLQQWRSALLNRSRYDNRDNKNVFSQLFERSKNTCKFVN